MFDHVTIRVSDLEASRRFYALAFDAIELGEAPTAGGGFLEWRDFSIAAATDERPVTRRLHVAFVARARERVEEFWRALTDAGYSSDGEPGLRPQYRPDYYGAFVLDPDGNSVEAVHHARLRDDGGTIDHLWIRVSSVAVSRRFYKTIGPAAGFEVGHESEERVLFRGPVASFSIVAGEPTEGLHLAFPARDRAAVGEFHRLAVAAGYRDNGAPGERPVYHPGYYAAYALDPDGSNVEVVFHDRR